MNIDPNTTKYMVKAKINADGIIEKPDVVGAIFGQTEGLLETSSTSGTCRSPEGSAGSRSR